VEKFETAGEIPSTHSHSPSPICLTFPQV